MKGHWLFGVQEGSSWEEVGSWAEQEAAADPQAAAIPELEAEQFVSVCYLLMFASPSMLHLFKRGLAVPLPIDKPHERRRATVAMLRKWRQPTLRNLLISTVPRTIIGRFLDPELNPDFWTLAHFREAFAEGMNICLLTQYKRLLDPAADIAQWLPTVSEFAPVAYTTWIQISRLTMRRVVYNTVSTAGADTQSAAALLEDVKAKSAETGVLRQDLRRTVQERKRLKEEARRQELERKQLLSQAEGELAAARRQLNDRRHAMHQELVERARRHENALSRLRRELEVAQAEFLAGLRGKVANYLHRQAVAVQGGETPVNRLLVETLGGTWAPADATVIINGEAGPADVERQLHGVGLAGVQIRCDGSRRRKGRRPAIATSAFAVYLESQVVYHHQQVVCCSHAATSQMAEYGAVILALSWLLVAGPAPGSRVEIWSDCRTMVDQVTGRKPAAEVARGCRTLHRKLLSLLTALRHRGCLVDLRWVRREHVDACDRLCDVAYREATWYHRPAASGRHLPLAGFIRSLPGAKARR